MNDAEYLENMIKDKEKNILKLIEDLNIRLNKIEDDLIY